MMKRPRLIAAVCMAVGCHGPAPGSGSDDASIDASTDPPTDGANGPRDGAGIDAAPLPPQTTRLRIVSRCAVPIWIAHSNNVAAVQNVELATGAYHDYDIPDGGLASARFWPKLGCDAGGHGCTIGDSGEGGGAPCGPTGCQPPLDSKFEVTFAPVGSGQVTFYNLSLVDGYTLPFSVTPVGAGAGSGSCIASDCSMLSLAECPAELQVPSGCLSPCKHWNYPPPWGLGQPESIEPGRHLCCPAPVTPAQCQDASDPRSVVHTEYVALIHARCPTAYSYAYDDEAGLHACPAATAFEVTFCP
jgi:hypothetical protein